MKYVKSIVLAAVAASALCAFVEAGTASATVLCKTPGIGSPTGTTCPAGEAYPAGTEIHAVSELEPYTTTTTFKTISCEESTFTAVTLNEGGEKESGNQTVSSLTAEKCNCEVKLLHDGVWTIEWIEGTHNGTVTSDELEETVSCSTLLGNVHCIYSTNSTDLGTLTGGSPATLDITAEIPRLPTSAACSEKATWHAKYKITTPTPLYVAGHT